MGQEEETQDNPSRVFLTKLPQGIKKATIKAAFEEHGTVAEIEFKYGADLMRVRGVAFVTFESQETADKVIELNTITIEDKEVEIKKAIEGTTETSSVAKEDEDLLTLPKEALHCYVCKRDKFPSLDAFLNHKKGKQHQANFKLLRSKSSSVLQLLKAEARLAAERSYDFNWLRNNPLPKRPNCDICGIQLTCKPTKHKFSTEHKMVRNFMMQRCCNIEFKDRAKFDMHLLSLRHLKTAYEKKMSQSQNEEDRLTMKKAIDIYKKCDGDLKELKETYGDLDLTADLAPFDNTPIGLNYIVKKINYYCICCDQRFFATDEIVDPHCRSYSHYSNMMDLILEREKGIAARAQKRKLEEAEAEERPSKRPALEDVKIETKVKREVKTVKKTNIQEKKSSAQVKTEVKKEVKEEVKKEEEEESPVKDVEMADEEEEAAPELEDEGYENEDEEMPEEVQDEEEEEAAQGEVGDDYEIQEVDDEEEEAEEEDEDGVQIIDQEEAEDDDEVQAVDQEEENEEEVQAIDQEEEEEPAVEETPEVEDDDVVEEEPKPRPARARRSRARGRAGRR